VWQENGVRRQREAASEDRLAARLEKVTERLQAAVHLRPGAGKEPSTPGMGHLTTWYGMCSDQDHRDTVFYEPPHDLGHRPLNGWMTRPDA
jgi:hypothetical protein